MSNPDFFIYIIVFPAVLRRGLHILNSSTFSLIDFVACRYTHNFTWDFPTVITRCVQGSLLLIQVYMTDGIILIKK